MLQVSDCFPIGFRHLQDAEKIFPCACRLQLTPQTKKPNDKVYIRYSSQDQNECRLKDKDCPETYKKSPGSLFIFAAQLLNIINGHRRLPI